MRGRQPFAITDELQEIATELMFVRGTTIGYEQLTQELERHREARLASRGGPIDHWGSCHPLQEDCREHNEPPSGHAGFLQCQAVSTHSRKVIGCGNVNDVCGHGSNHSWSSSLHGGCVPPRVRASANGDCFCFTTQVLSPDDAASD